MQKRSALAVGVAVAGLATLLTCSAMAATLGDGPVDGGTPVSLSISGGADISLHATIKDANFMVVNGEVYSWGFNRDGVLARPDIADETYVAQPALISRGEIPVGVKIVQLDAQSEHVLALGDDGEIYGWGGNGDQKIGHPVPANQPAVHTPVKVSRGSIPAGATVIQVGATADASVALTDEGLLYSWGYGWYIDYLGDIASPMRLDHRSLEPGVKIERFDAGQMTVHAQASNGKTYGWGLNAYGMVNPNRHDSNLYGESLDWLPLSPGESVRMTSQALLHVSALTSDGRVLSWGLDTGIPSAGNGNSMATWGSMKGEAALPGQIPADTTLTHLYSQMNYSTYVLGDDGIVYMWGRTPPQMQSFLAGNTNAVNNVVPIVAELPGLLPGEYVVDLTQGAVVLIRTSLGRVMEWGPDYDSLPTDPYAPPSATESFVQVAHVEIGDIAFGSASAVGAVSFAGQEVLSPAHAAGEVEVTGRAFLVVDGARVQELGAVNWGTFEYVAPAPSPEPSASPSSSPSAGASPSVSATPSVVPGGSQGGSGVGGTPHGNTGSLSGTGADVSYVWLPVLLAATGVALLGWSSRGSGPTRTGGQGKWDCAVSSAVLVHPHE